MLVVVFFYSKQFNEESLGVVSIDSGLRIKCACLSLA